MDPGSPEELVDAANTSLLHYRALNSAAQAADPPRSRWHETIKFRVLLHLARQGRRNNPRCLFSGAYRDESYMSIVKDVTEACCAATRTQNVMGKVVQKMLLGLGMMTYRECETD